MINPHKIINKYISVFYPHIHEVTSLSEVNVVKSWDDYFFFCYGTQSIIAIRFSSNKDTYVIKGIDGFSSSLCNLLSLTTREINDHIMKWISNKHPEIQDYENLYDFCKTNHKKFSEIKAFQERRRKISQQ